MIPFLLGLALASLFWSAVFLWLDYRRRHAPSITQYRRRQYRDAPPETSHDPPPMPSEMARDATMYDVGTIDYRFLGVTGEER